MDILRLVTIYRDMTTLMILDHRVVTINLQLEWVLMVLHPALLTLVILSVLLPKNLIDYSLQMIP